MTTSFHPSQDLLRAVKAKLVHPQVVDMIRDHAEECRRHCNPAFFKAAPLRAGEIPPRDLARMSQDYLSKVRQLQRRGR